MKYTQCTLKKGDNTFTQCWLETAKIKIGRFVQLITLDNDFWQVMSMGKQQDEDPSLKYRTWSNNI